MPRLDQVISIGCPVEDVTVRCAGQLETAKVAPGHLPITGRQAHGLSFWADDGVVWMTGVNEAKLLTVGNAVLETILRWAHDSQIQVSERKSVAMLFHRRRETGHCSEMEVSAKSPAGNEVRLPVTDAPQRMLRGEVVTAEV